MQELLTTTLIKPIKRFKYFFIDNQTKNEIVTIAAQAPGYSVFKGKNHKDIICVKVR